MGLSPKGNPLSGTTKHFKGRRNSIQCKQQENDHSWMIKVIFLSWVAFSDNTELICRHINPLNTKLNPICHLLALVEAHHILHISRIRVNETDIYSSFLLWDFILFPGHVLPGAGGSGQISFNNARISTPHPSPNLEYQSILVQDVAQNLSDTSGPTSS